MDLNRVNALLDQLRAEVNPPPAPTEPIYETEDALNRAISERPGQTLLVSPTLVYNAPLALRGPVTLRSSAAITGRVPKDFPCPRFLGGVTMPGNGIALDGLGVTHTKPEYPLVDDTGVGNRVERCVLLGDPVKGQRRAIGGNGSSALYARNYIGRIFSPPTATWTDSNGIAVWTPAGPISIVDNFIEASSEGILIGGGDPIDAAHDPRQVRILDNWVTKDLAWRGLGYKVKNGIELKNCRDFIIRNNDVENVWADAQAGYGLVLTVHNQDGRNPTATIQDGVVDGNRFHSCAGGLIVLAKEYITETDKNGRDVPFGAVRRSELMARVTVGPNVWTDINAKTWFPDGSPKLVSIEGGPEDFGLIDNDFSTAIGFSSVVYFNKGPKAERMTVTGNKWPRTKYGIFGAGVTVNAARDAGWAAFVASGNLANNTDVVAAS